MSLFPSAAAKNAQVKVSTESILFGVNFAPLLLAGETLTGTPNVTSSVSGLTIAAPIVNTATFIDDDSNTVGIGQGVQVRISSGVDATDYTLKVTCGTSLGNTRCVVCTLRVRDS
jgi:hypothetical protein